MSQGGGGYDISSSVAKSATSGAGLSSAFQFTGGGGTPAFMWVVIAALGAALIWALFIRKH